MARTLRTQDELNWTSKEDRDIREVLAAWEAARRAKAHQEMAAAAAARGEQRYLEAPDGFGGYVAIMVHPASFHYWGQRLGYQCWNDDGFKREYWRDNPACRVKHQSRRPTVVVADTGGLTAGKKRFSRKF